MRQGNITGHGHRLVAISTGAAAAKTVSLPKAYALTKNVSDPEIDAVYIPVPNTCTSRGR